MVIASVPASRPEVFQGLLSPIASNRCNQHIVGLHYFLPRFFQPVDIKFFGIHLHVHLATVIATRHKRIPAKRIGHLLIC